MYAVMEMRTNEQGIIRLPTRYLKRTIRPTPRAEYIPLRLPPSGQMSTSTRSSALTSMAIRSLVLRSTLSIFPHPHRLNKGVMLNDCTNNQSQ